MYDIIKNSKILIVDDQPVNLKIFLSYLSKHNDNVLSALNGQTAIEIAEKERPDIILLDIMMPGMDGYEVCRILKEKETTKDIPVIFMSALSETQNIVKGFEAGGIDYITKPIKYQEALARLSTHLNLKHMEKELIQKEKFESLWIMAGGIAHNFNNILAGIIGFAELGMMTSPKEETVRDYFNNIITSANRAASITRQILDYTGNFQFMTVTTSLSHIIKEISNLMDISLPKNCNLIYELSDDLLLIECDNHLIKKVIMNLIINSSEAIGDKEGIVIVRTGIVECNKEFFNNCIIKENNNPGLYVFLEVEDNGCGISEEILSKIFDPFFTTKFTGRGLGLAAAIGIIKSHNSNIMIKSEDGKGTSVKLLFPSVKPSTINNSP